jgi:hypothetical protein
MSRVKRKTGEALKKLVAEHLIRLGAKPGGEVPFGILGLPYDFVLETKCGLLGVSPYDNWVACRFRDVERAKAGTVSGYFNPYSGKWNHHYYEWPPQEALADFVRQLNEVLE